ncbi:DUF3618 domain-containing protein [Nakamurella flava]|uniref:DUF3618 domain-containing protein n=1 Tax=Nakamurella flava TaxID=2576308 RepID=A0A4U6QLJ7_9ACTN|nr:DUF3618 domain-containing protein [Nakamurella flava]TKV61022.1 DUF3618 domain-containing protein [Nakamurella flava]
MTTSNDPETIRREIEATRAGLSDDVNALGDKVNPASVARRQTEKVRGAAVSVREAVMGSASDVADRGQHALSGVQDNVAEAPSAIKRRTRGNPVAAGLIAFGAGLLAASLLPASEPEQQAAQKLKEQAQPVVDELTEVAKEAAGHLKEPAQQAVEEVKSTATDAAQAVKDETASGAEDLKEQAQQSKSAVQSAGS